MKVAFRTDSSTQIGSGHLMRCLTLAEALRKKGAEVVFLSRELRGDLSSVIEEKGFFHYQLPQPEIRDKHLDWNKHASWLQVHWQRDAEECLSLLRQSQKKYDWLIVDHYALDKHWEKMLRAVTSKLMVIDDLADREHECDLLLDQNNNSNSDGRYDHLVPDKCQLLLGPKYALLREEFLQKRQMIQARIGCSKNVLVFMGACDPYNETLKVLKAILASCLDLHGDVIVGSRNPNKKEIQSFCEENLPRIKFNCQINNMSELIAEADFAICAGGTFSWERSCLGLPAIVVAVAENQEELSSFSARQGECLYLGERQNVSVNKIMSALEIFCNCPELLESFSKKGMVAVDGHGLRRVLGVLSPLKISLRQATKADCDSIHQWRNDENTRKHIFNSEPIPIGKHRVWFDRALSDPNCLILVAELNDGPVGVLRYDLKGDDALVSVYLVPGERLPGTGTEILRNGNDWLSKNRPEIKTVRAEILEENIASLKAFLAAGYTKYNSTFLYDLGT